MNAKKFIPTAVSPTTGAFLTWRMILASDWKLILIGSLASLLIASIVMSGLPGGLMPDLSRPYAYAGDGLFHAWMAQRVTEGWLFDNMRSGYPFGSSFLDFPGSDGGDHLLIKIFSMLGGGWPAGVKLFYLFGFPTCFIATYIVARAFGLNRSFAVTTSVLYTFAPFHFLRLQHLFYTWYFIAPIFFYLALDIYLTRESVNPKGVKSTLRKLPAILLCTLIIASFGVYYALFGVIILASAAVMSIVKTGSTHGLKKAGLLIVATMFAVFLNILPNMIGNFKDGPNLEVAQRSTIESEVYGMKMMQLFMPRPDHRVGRLAGIAQRYNQGTPLVNENSTSTLGVIGAAGFILVLLYLIFAPERAKSDARLRLLAVTTFILFLFATIGGLGSLFAMTVSPSIRAWNRDSIFIACGALLFFFIALQIILQKITPRLATYSVYVASALMLIGFFDQTTSPCKSCIIAQNASFDSDKDFIQSIERNVPVGGAIYQLPYIGFPEVPMLERLINYQMMIGVLHSSTLHWSFGGMKGRPGDLFYRSLSQEPMTRQLEVISKLGFNGIYIDRRGYADNGEAVIKQLSQLLQKEPLLQSNSKEIVFFKLENTVHTDLTGMSAKQIQRQAGYFGDALGPRYSGDLASGIDFTRNGMPEFITDAQGLYGIEPWGRWSAEQASFEFTTPLPQKFTLAFKAQAYAGNSKKPTRILIGSREYSIQFTADVSEVDLKVDLEGATAERITIVPPAPISPSQVSGNTDGRILGIGFISMRIIQ